MRKEEKRRKERRGERKREEGDDWERSGETG